MCKIRLIRSLATHSPLLKSMLTNLIRMRFQLKLIKIYLLLNQVKKIIRKQETHNLIPYYKVKKTRTQIPITSWTNQAKSKWFKHLQIKLYRKRLHKANQLYKMDNKHLRVNRKYYHSHRFPHTFHRMPTSTNKVKNNPNHKVKSVPKNHHKNWKANKPNQINYWVNHRNKLKIVILSLQISIRWLKTLWVWLPSKMVL